MLNIKRVQNAIQNGVIKQSQSKDGKYTVYRYDKDMVAESDRELGVFRSLVFSNETNDLLCYGPEKSLSESEFRKDLCDASSVDGLCVTETIEGTMINLFWDPIVESWEISTRSGVGGNYWYNRTQYGADASIAGQKTFRQMFIECLNGDITNPNVGDVPGVEYLDREYSYSFVIQHPDNHFVYRIKRPIAYLVAVYKIDKATDVDEMFNVDWIDFEKVCGKTGQLVYVQTAAALGCPSIEILRNKSHLLEKFVRGDDASYQEWFNSPHPMGYMIVNRATGRRFAIENDQYKRIKELRGNNPNLQYQYLALNRTNQVTEFLSYFPQYKKQFYAFYKQYHEFITEVHNSYVNYYILKKRDPIAKKYFVHVSKIHHSVYLPSLVKTLSSGERQPLVNGAKTVITHRVVREYFDALSPSSQIYYLNLEQ